MTEYVWSRPVVSNSRPGDILWPPMTLKLNC